MELRLHPAHQCIIIVESRNEKEIEMSGNE
jgi:hypothetical protein